jgi:hypothetical protein
MIEAEGDATGYVVAVLVHRAEKLVVASFFHRARR